MNDHKLQRKKNAFNEKSSLLAALTELRSGLV